MFLDVLNICNNSVIQAFFGEKFAQNWSRSFMNSLLHFEHDSWKTALVKGILYRSFSMCPMENDLHQKPLTSAVFLGSSKNPKKIKFWSLSLVTFANISLLGALQKFSEQLWSCRLFSKHFLDITEDVEKRIVAIQHIDNDLDKKPLTSAGFLGSYSKCSKEFISLQDQFWANFAPKNACMALLGPRNHPDSRMLLLMLRISRNMFRISFKCNSGVKIF